MTYKSLSLLFFMASVLLVSSCTEKIDTSARYVFKEESVVSYLDKHPEDYSVYTDLLGKVKVSNVSSTTVKQLLSARGNYTCFVPTNEAIQIYLDSLVTQGIISAPSWDAFPDSATLDSIREVIVQNSIIDGGDLVRYEIGSLPITQDAEIPTPNMYDRKLPVHYGESTDEISILSSPIDLRNRNIPAINGVIHAVHRVIAPSNNTLSHLLNTIQKEKRPGFMVSSMLAIKVGLSDTLDKYRDEHYEDLYQRGLIPDLDVVNGNGGSNYKGWAPRHRYYGFTYFAETDDFWSAELGKPAEEITPEDVMAYLQEKNVYPEAKVDKNYTDPDNLLNTFVTYHFLPMRLPTDGLVSHYNEKGFNPSTGKLSVAMTEYYTTMGKRRLIKLFESYQSEGIYINRFPVLDNGRRGNYAEVSCLPEKEGIRIGQPNLEGENNVRNGIIYPIEKLLVYDEKVRNSMQAERIRWDVSAMFPELTNNGYRMSKLTDEVSKSAAIPPTTIYRYLEDAVEITAETYFFYWTGRNEGWANYLGDEFNLQGLTDVTLRLPPVPARGTYELRFAVQSGGARGMVQFYWGSDLNHLAVQGIPLDIRLSPNSEEGRRQLGWQADTEDDDFNAEVDKVIRNKGFMKGSEIHIAGSPGGTTTGRASTICSRRIIVRQTMDPDKTYYIRFKSVMDDPTRQFYMDYLEYCAKDVYDNPERPEDIW